MNCWDLAREKDDDYRCFFNICRDCIVFVLKSDSSVLSNQEVLEILKTRPNCSLARDYVTLPPQCGNVIPLPQR